MSAPDGIHHLAICTGDIKAQIAFFHEVLGMELVALYWMHGVQGAWHAFLRLNDHSYCAFVQTPEVAKLERRIGVTHAGNAANPVAGGAMQHVAFHVASEAELLALRDRIRSHGIAVIGPIDHGLCKSIYFAGPEDLALEIATSERAIDRRAWIDPEVVALAGISAEEIERFRRPAPYTPPPTPVPQPPMDPAKPWLRGYPEAVWRRILATPDEVVTATASEPAPPVAVES